MIEGRRFIAVVPARGGSKSVPRKNIRRLAGRPLLAWTSDQIKAVPEIDIAVVSTDDPAIARVAEQEGLRVIMRPKELAIDTAPTERALLHALDVLRDMGEPPFDYVVVLEPTSPLRRPETIRRCMSAIVERNGRSLMTVVESRSNIGRLSDGIFRPLDRNAPRRRQDRAPVYIESSTVYAASVEHLRKTGTLVCSDWLAEVVHSEEAVDINTELDFLVAERLIGAAADNRDT
jgi:CMP-N,N'-diacetyllegionaminic acid synthase